MSKADTNTAHQMLADEQAVDDNLVQRLMDGSPHYVCRHCDTPVAPAGPDWRHRLTKVFEGAPSTAGPHLNDNARHYLDMDVVLRQGFCPGCFTALFTETVPARNGETP
ncbi:hypothetical protein [Streptomyces malaysiensis]|uniref:Uncharacterized protein n=1 Tax=Streptomyces malaysiensis subsp. samsunensis TaxID=459658 RepID=A0A9X2LYW2_STRMQ|nr:hypothetical protein [Streptomyces samsunensis]MCQ8832041.1 hypothetical protein [Streptomyces samsunensis]